MRITFETHDLLPLLALAQRMTVQRKTLPILKHLLLTTTADNGMSIGATDLETDIRLQCPVRVLEPGAITVDAEKFHAVIKELSGEVSLRSVNEATSELKREKSKFQFLGFSPEDFPSILPRQTTPLMEMQMTAEELIAAIDAVAFSVAIRDSRQYLNGFYLCRIGNAVKLVASDGLRMAETILLPEAISKGDWSGVVLPRQGVLDTYKAIEKIKGSITLAVHAAVVTLTAPALEISMRLIEGQFPNYEQIIPKTFTQTVVVTREEILGAVRRLCILTSESVRGITFTIGAKSLRLSVDTPDLGKGEEEVSSTGGEPLTVTFVGKHLLDYLLSTREQQIELKIADEKKPILLRAVGNEKTQYITMPLFRER